MVFFKKIFFSLKLNVTLHCLETAVQFQWNTTSLRKSDFPLWKWPKLGAFTKNLTTLADSLTPNYCYLGLLEHGISCSTSTEGYFSWVFSPQVSNHPFMLHFWGRYIFFSAIQHPEATMLSKMSPGNENETLEFQPYRARIKERWSSRVAPKLHTTACLTHTHI